MPPAIYSDAAGIGIEGAEQRLKPVENPYDQRRCSQRLQVLGQKPHPQFFARADQDDRGEQQNDVAPEPQKIEEGFHSEPPMNANAGSRGKSYWSQICDKLAKLLILQGQPTLVQFA